MAQRYGHIQQYEKDILEMRENGFTLREIGERLGFSYKQIRTTTTTTTKPVVDPVVPYNPKMGDPSGDGKIDAIDASIVLNVYAKLATNKTQAAKDELAYCDVNKDGKVNAIDASYVLSYYAYISTFKGTENDKVDFVTFVMNT